MNPRTGKKTTATTKSKRSATSETKKCDSKKSINIIPELLLLGSLPEISAPTKQNTPFLNEFKFLNSQLQAMGQLYPYEFATKALYEFITEGECFSMALVWRDFVREIRNILLRPDVAEQFLMHSKTTEKGLYDNLKNLELFFTALLKKEVVADLYKIGITEYPERYTEDNLWGGTDIIYSDFTSKPRTY